MKINKVVYLIFFFLLVMMIVSCQNDVNIIWPEERDKNTVSITITTEYEHNRERMVYPGEKVTLESRSDSLKHIIDDTKTVVWTVTEVSDKDNFMYSEHTDGGVTSIEKVFKNEGTYKISADLYNSEDYQSIGVGAPLLDSDECEITVEVIDFEIETVVIDEKVMQFKPQILNPEIGPVYTELHMYFGDNTKEVFEESNVGAITHSYNAEGIYKVTAELIYTGKDNNTIIAQSDTSVRMKGDLYIVAPSGPLKTDTVYTFQAHQVKKLPSSSAYQWDFGDGAISKIPYTNEVSHLFIKPGSYVVSVDVLDSEVMGENILASTFLPVEVVESANFLNELHSMDKFDLDFSVHHDYTDLTTGLFRWDWDSYGEIIWDGTHFSMEWSQDRHSEHMIGRVSEDGTRIEHLIIRHEFIDYDRAQTNQWFELVIHDLPFSFDEAPERFTANKRGEELNDTVIYFNTYKTETYHWTKDAELNVRFEKE
ncbi:MAG: PKD domain-containing protein [Dehalococcoidales bacterium]|nr:MAG: PKD domain-containing protein [Dehalococcoidales bacterium]